MPNQTVSYANGVITLTKRDSSQVQMVFDGESEGAVEADTFTTIRQILHSELTFGASGSMLWTVAEGDLEDCIYMESGKLSMLWFRATATSIGGTLSTELRIDLPPSIFPASYTSAGLDQFICQGTAVLEGTLAEMAIATITKAGYQISIRRAAGSNFTNSTNNLHVSFLLVWATQNE